MDKKYLKKIQENFVESPLFSIFQIFDKYPRTIYKYRSWDDEFHKRILTHNEIFMSPPNLFNDPFDCRIYENYSWLHDEEKRKLHIEESLFKNSNYILKNFQDEDEARKVISDNLSNPSLFQIQAEKKHDEFTDKHIGIVSFAENCDSILMWSHYANNHKGFSIGFDEKKIKLSGLFDICESVIYSEDMPDVYIDKSRTKKINQELYKSIEWEYEREYRAISLFPDGKDKKPINRKVIFKDSYIKEVIFGLLTPQEHKDEIAKIAMSKNISVFKMVKIPFKFKLIKIPYELK